MTVAVSRREGWSEVPLWSVLQRKKELGQPDLKLLSVYRDYGVIEKDSRDDNYNRAGADLAAYQVVRPGDVVANKMKTWQGSIAVSDLKGLVSPAYIVCSVDPAIHSRFLHYLLRSKPYIAEYKRLSHGVRPAQWDLRWEDLRDVRLALPPAGAQRAIADFLDRETGRIDALVEKKRRLIELLEEKRTALISHVVTKGLDPTVPMKDSGIPWLGEIPAHWEALSLARVSYQMTNGYVGPTRDILVDEGVPYVQSLHIKNGQIRHNGDFFVTEEWHRAHDRTRLRVGDVLVVQTGDIGQSAVVDESVAGANCHALIIIRPDLMHIAPQFLGYLLRSEGGKGSVLATRTGATHPHLNVGYVRDVKLPIPPVDEQRRIAAYLSTQHDTSVRVAEKIREQLYLLAEYRQCLITAAVTGQLDVSVPRIEEGP